jgi:hypothetical protein
MKGAGSEMDGGLRILFRMVLVVAIVVLGCFGIVFFTELRYSRDPARTKDLEDRVKRLEGAPYVQSSLERHAVRYEIVSADEQSTFSAPPPLQLAANGGTNRFRLTDHWKMIPGTIFVGAWFDQWSPRSDIMKFEDLYVQPFEDAGGVELVAVPRQGQTVKMSVTVHFLMKTDLRVPARRQ